MTLLPLVQRIMGARFDHLTPALAFRLAAHLAAVVPELLHLPPDHHLSAEARLKVEDAIAEFELEVLP